jgi:hypothetical protein
MANDLSNAMLFRACIFEKLRALKVIDFARGILRGRAFDHLAGRAKARPYAGEGLQ